MSITVHEPEHTAPAVRTGSGQGTPTRGLRHAGPNWFAAVMGTGIVSTAAVTLPVQPPALRALAVIAWVLASTLFLAMLCAAAHQAIRFPGAALAHLRHPVLRNFYGAVPMAVLVVGSSTLLAGSSVIGDAAAVGVDLVLWPVGTALGLATAVVVPYYAFTRPGTTPHPAFGGWLMPVVPPMVSAATGALLVPHVPVGQAREALILSCYAMFAMSLIASLYVISRICGRILRHGVGPAAMVPTLWIVLGPLGQSITAVNLLAKAAPSALATPQVAAADALALFYGITVWGVAMLWLMFAVTVTIRTARVHLPFALSWWSFTFPVGTLVTAASALAARTGLPAFSASAVLLFVVLVTAWAIVTVRTCHGLRRGDLLVAMPAQP